jgi:hypothetical protein
MFTCAADLFCFEGGSGNVSARRTVEGYGPIVKVLHSVAVVLVVFVWALGMFGADFSEGTGCWIAGTHLNWANHSSDRDNPGPLAHGQSSACQSAL